MSKRLTEQVWFKDIKGDKVGHLNLNGFEWFIKDNILQQQVVNKLGKLEDIMDKYGIESVEALGNELGSYVLADGFDKNGKEVNKVIFETYKKKFESLLKQYKQIKQDRDTWKKACELIVDEFNECLCNHCEALRKCENCNGKYTKEMFYQQAQKEMKGE